MALAKLWIVDIITAVDPTTELVLLAVDLVKTTHQVSYNLWCAQGDMAEYAWFTWLQMSQLFGTGESDDICLLGIFNETVHIVINNDSFVEGNEVLYIQLVLNSNNNQVEIVNDTITLVIFDDDGKL